MIILNVIQGIQKHLLICILYLLVSSASLTFAETDILPKEIGNWKTTNVPDIYVGEELFILIDGGADIFYEYGFIQVFTQKYFNGDNTISVEVYEMTNSDAAYGIYSIKTVENKKKIKLGDDASGGEGFIMFRKEKYFVTLSVYTDNEISRSALMEIGEAINLGIKGSVVKPELANVLMQQNFVHDKIIYLKGNLALYNVYVFDIDDIFGIEEGITGVYKSSNSFVFKYSSAEVSKKYFQNAVDKMSLNRKFVKVVMETDKAVFQEKKKIINLIRKSNYIVIVMGSRRKEVNALTKNFGEIIAD